MKEKPEITEEDKAKGIIELQTIGEAVLSLATAFFEAESYHTGVTREAMAEKTYKLGVKVHNLILDNKFTPFEEGFLISMLLVTLIDFLEKRAKGEISS